MTTVGSNVMQFGKDIHAPHRKIELVFDCRQAKLMTVMNFVFGPNVHIVAY